MILNKKEKIYKLFYIFQIEHLFDGHACLHKFKIENGKVTYSNKFLETKSFTKSLAENRLYAGWFYKKYLNELI